jgi:hypothetical protein
MAVAVDNPKRRRVGWAPLLIGVGVLAGLAGELIREAAAPARAVCQVNAQFGSIERLLTTNVGPLPGLPTKAPSCTALDLRYDLGLGTALSGLAMILVGFVLAIRRGRRAADAGRPWPLRRAMDATATWLDVHLPGSRGRSTPRLRGGYLAALSAILVILAVSGAISWWNGYQRSERVHTYETATAALTTERLPPNIQRVAGPCGDTICATSALNPPQLDRELRHLLNGAPMPPLTAMVPCPGPCPVTLFGHFDGAVAIADAFWNLVVVRNGKVRKGAIPARRGVRARRGVPDAYYLGSTILIDTIDPRQANTD